MVDIVARVVADGDTRVLSFKTNEVIFGGGRLTTKTNEIGLDYDEFLNVYDEANGKATEKPSKPETKNDTEQTEKGHINENISSDNASEAPAETEAPEEQGEQAEPKTRVRRTRRTEN